MLVSESETKLQERDGQARWVLVEARSEQVNRSRDGWSEDADAEDRLSGETKHKK